MNYNQQKRKFIVRDPHGIHARPAAMITKTASIFESNIKIKNKKMIVNAKSILSVLSLEASFNSEVTITANGNDAKEAVVALEKVFSEFQNQED